jgi:putative NADH-flavin reductase
MKVILFGATGFAGGAIATELVSRGHQVVGVARSITQAVPAGVETVEGTIHDSAFVRTVTEGADAIVVAIPGRAIDGKSLLDVAPALLEVATERGLRLAIVGGAGGLNATPGGPRVADGADFPEAYKSEAFGQIAVLEKLRASSTAVDWFYVSPSAEFGAHNPGEATGSYRLGADDLLVADDGRSYISGADYAKAFVDELETPVHQQKRFTVGY